MLRGDKQLPATTPASADGVAQRAAALAIAAAAGAGVAWLVSLGG
ncbi:MAG TPA: hypothetical protein VFQ16_10300 [Burkholderiaceae bacterium]|nr:hypothetical protein [Burkholderiaceae bacterium]